MNSLTTIILAVIASGGVTAAINAYFNRDKDKAQVHNMNIEGDLKVGDNWKEYAAVLRKDLDRVKDELTLLHNKYLDLETKYNSNERKYLELEAKYNILQAEHENVLVENKRSKERIVELQTQVDLLQAELDKYKKQNA